MKLHDAQILEITAPVSFPTTAARDDHFIRHVLERSEKQGSKGLKRGNERWHQIFGMHAVTAARDEFHAQRRPGKTDQLGPLGSHLAKRYEHLLSDHLIDCCARVANHCHLARTQLDPSSFTGPEVALRAHTAEIWAWPTTDQIFIVAVNRLKEGSCGGYTIRTGYRPWPNLSARGFERKRREWLLKRLLLGTHSEVAMHDQNQNATSVSPQNTASAHPSNAAAASPKNTGPNP